MDTVTFATHSKFISIALDSRYETEFNGVTLKHPLAKKVCMLSDTMALVGIGNQFKVWDVYKYLTESSKLGHLTDYDEVLNTLSDVFNSANEDANKIIEESKEMIAKVQKGRLEIPSEELLEIFADKPSHLAALQDMLTGMKYNQPILTQFFLIGWDELIGRCRMTSLIIFGHKMHSVEMPLETELIYIQSASVTKEIDKVKIIDQQAANRIHPISSINLLDTSENVVALLDEIKKIQVDLLKELNSYVADPTPVYYELSERTGFSFKQPEENLKEIIFNRIAPKE